MSLNILYGNTTKTFLNLNFNQKGQIDYPCLHSEVFFSLEIDYYQVSMKSCFYNLPLFTNRPFIPLIH